jgi:hypothetical protein
MAAMTPTRCCWMALVAASTLAACRPADAPKEPTDPKEPTVLADELPAVDPGAIGAAAPNARRMAMLRLN